MERTSIYESTAIFLCPPQPGQGRYPVVIKELQGKAGNREGAEQLLTQLAEFAFIIATER
jgi:hypothetical protein